MENAINRAKFSIIDLRITHCTLTLHRSREINYTSINCKASFLGEIRTSENRQIGNIDWEISVSRDSEGSKFTQDNNAIGVLNHYPETKYEFDNTSPECCSAAISLDGATFDSLCALVESGKFAGFRLHVTGIGYGWEPDGSAKEWDVTNHNTALIDSVEIVGHLINPVEQSESPDSFFGPDEPVLPEDNRLDAAMRIVENGLDKVNSRLGWVIALLVTTWLAIFFH